MPVWVVPAPPWCTTLRHWGNNHSCEISRIIIRDGPVRDARDILWVTKRMFARSGWLAKNWSTWLKPCKLINPRLLSCSRLWIHVPIIWCCSAASNMMLIVLPMPMYTGASPDSKNFACKYSISVYYQIWQCRRLPYHAFRFFEFVGRTQDWTKHILICRPV